MMSGNNHSPGGVAHREPPQNQTNILTSAPSWDDSLKPTKNTFSDIYSALRSPGKEAPRPLMNIRPPKSNQIPPHLRLTRAKSGAIVKTADLLGLGDISSEANQKDPPIQECRSNSESLDSLGMIMGMQKSRTSISTVLDAEKETPLQAPKISPPQNKRQETAQDHARRIEQEISANEKLLSDANAIGFVPPHLRPVIPETIYETEDANGNWIPPHLRRPKNTRAGGRGPALGSVNTAWPQVHGSYGPLAKPSKVSVVLTPLTQAPRKAENAADNKPVGAPVRQMNLNTHRTLNQPFTQQPRQTGPIVSENDTKIPQHMKFQEPLRHTTMANSLGQRSERTRRAATPPPPPSNISTAYYPLPPESPPPRRPVRAPSYSRNNTATSLSRQDARSYYGRSSYGGDDNQSQFLLLDHQRARMMRSYTKYRAKPGYAPHDPRLPFEYMLNSNPKANPRAGSTVAKSVSTSSKKYHRPAGRARNITSQSQQSSYRVTEYNQSRGGDITAALRNVFLEDGEEEDDGNEEDQRVGEEAEEYEEEENEYYEEGENEGRTEVRTDNSGSKAWSQLPRGITNERPQRPRGVILSGLPRNQTLKQVSKVCSSTGAIENIQMSKKYGMALVTFVHASIAQRFYETTGTGGITLIFQDETQAIIKQQVFVAMNPEIVPLDEDIRYVIETADGSRVLKIIGWDRDILERSVGYEGETDVSYSELLMRLASRYVDSQERDRKVQGVFWKQSNHGHLEATFIFAGIKDAMMVRYFMEKEQDLEGCHFMFGTDP